jgi:hypothetical protein
MAVAPNTCFGLSTDTLQRAHFGMHRFADENSASVEFHIPHGEMIRLLRRSGFDIEDLVEIGAPPGCKRSEAPHGNGRLGSEMAERASVGRAQAVGATSGVDPWPADRDKRTPVR